MSFNFGGASSSAGQSNNATTSTAPASSSLFGSSTPATSSSLFGQAPGASSFPFGSNTGSGSNSNAATPSAGTGSSLFGSTAAKPSDQKPMFGGASATTAPTSGTSTPTGGAGGLFGGNNSQSASGGGLFGGGSSQPASSGGLFGGAGKPASTPGSLFGTTSSTPASTAANTTSMTSGAFPSGGVFGNKTPAGGTPTSQPSGLFANTSNSGASTSVFGSTSLSAPTIGATAATTPAKPLSFGAMNSTTPAGAPPTDTAKAAPSSMFSSMGKPASGGLFANRVGDSSSTTPTTGAASNSLFGNTGSPATLASSLSSAKPGESSTSLAFGGVKPAATQSSMLSAPTSSGNSLFGNKPAEQSQAKPEAPVFGGTSTTTPTTSAGTSSLFSKAGVGSTSTPTTTAPAASSQASGLFGNLKPTTTTTTSGPAEPAKPTSSLFGTATPASSAPMTSTTTASEAPKNTMSNMFGAAPASTTAASSIPASAATTTTTAPATSSILGGAKSADTLAPQNALGGTSNLGASTTGPTSQLARLKNKTMDEIITRWATDLSKYQKEFKEQAAQVAAWDRLLVENGEKIQKLYLNTYEAEKASREVERQLVTVESQQDELENWLNQYEKDVDQMFARDIGRTEQLAGPDQEREKTYKLAEKLTGRLDEMGRDLTKMIKEINDISGTLSKGNKPDDPLSQIVRVLNGHLTQLQWIDTNAATLQAKVNAAQKASATIGNQYGGTEHDAAETFYRSYMGRR